jgi:hypothetical protein
MGVAVTINVDTGAVARGEYLAASSTSGAAKGVGFFNAYSAIAVATTAKAAGSTGTVSALLLARIPFAIEGTTAWACGGDIGGYATTDAQKFIMAAATWATIAGAALGTNRASCPLGFANGTTDGYIVGGYTGFAAILTAFKLSFASETWSAVSGMDMTTTSYNCGSSQTSSLKGYSLGKSTGVWVTEANKFTFSAATRAALSALATAGTSGKCYSSDGTTIHCVKTAAEKCVVASDTISTNAGGNYTAASAIHCPSLNFPATAGYSIDGMTCKKMLFSSAVISTLGSSPTLTHQDAFAVGDGLAYGWACGKNTTPYGGADKFTYAAETWAVDSGAQLVVGKFSGAYFNNGAY